MEEFTERVATKYAPAERSPQKVITYQRNLVDSFITVKPFIDDINHAIVILNRNRQIVYANKLFFRIVNLLASWAKLSVTCFKRRYRFQSRLILLAI